MADKINPTVFTNFEVRQLAEQVKEEIRCLWGAKKEVVERIAPLEADLERRQGNRVVDERHARVRSVLKIMEETGLGKGFFLGKTSINAGTTVLAYAGINEVELTDEIGTRSIITGEIQRYYNLERDKKSGKFYDPKQPTQDK